MYWTNNDLRQYEMRDSSYNRCLCCNRESLERMVSKFDTIFDPFLNFTDQIASIRLYPFSITFKPPMLGDTIAPASALNTATYKLLDIYDFYEINPTQNHMNLGQFKVEPRFNNFADYNGYTKIICFLPFVGFVNIDVNECMGKWLQFRLDVDFFTGRGLFTVGVSDVQMANESYPSDLAESSMRIISTFDCTLGVEIPLGSSNAGEIQRNILLGAVKVATGVASAVAGMNLPPAVTTSVTNVEPKVKTYDVQGRGKYKGARMKQMKAGTETVSGGSKTTTTTHHTPVNKVKPVSDAIDSSIDVLNNLKVGGESDRINDMSMMWRLATNVHVIIYRPKFVTLDENYGSLYGYPLGDTYELGDLTGYTEINAIHIEGEGFETITNKEVALLEEVFANGIIL